MRTLSLLALLFTVAACLPNTALAQDPKGMPRAMQGPMLGEMRPDGFTVWVRVSGPFPVTLEVGTDATLKDVKKFGPALAQKQNDYVVKLQSTGLQPSTAYWYRILVDGSVDRYLKNQARDGAFPTHTAPAPAAKTSFKVAFGSCARWQADAVQPLWFSVIGRHPDLFLWLGDNMYGDASDADILAEEYRTQRMVASLQPLLRSVPQLAIWDDHDYGIDNSDGRHPKKQDSLQVFTRYWANPAYGVPSAPGVFFRSSYGGVDFFCLDVRYHRSPNDTLDNDSKTMLGGGQYAWLIAELQKSTAPFKVLVAGGGWSKEKGKKGDAWSAFLRERNELFEFVREKNIGGVVLLSGDTHFAELNCIPWSLRGGYDLYDFVSSPLAQACETGGAALKPELRIRAPYSKSANFGLLEFDLTGEPKLTYRCVAADGSEPWPELVLKASELQNGVSSWASKVDKLALPDAKPDMEVAAPAAPAEPAKK